MKVTRIDTLVYLQNELDTSVEDSFQEAKDWNHLCETVLNRRLSIWNEFFEDLFIRRAKVRLMC